MMLGLLRLALLMLSSYGLLYFSYKYYMPWSGGSDFISYYPMYLQPLDITVAQGPFILRQLSAIATHLVLISGIYYPADIAFVDSRFDQRVFFAALCSNYLALVAAAWLSGKAVELLSGRRNLAYAWLAGLLCFLSTFSQQTVITGLTEGMSWLLMAAGFVAYLQRRHFLVALVVFLAIFQREAVIVAFGAIGACMAVLDPQDRKPHVTVFAWAVTCFIGYAVLRHWVGGYEYQLNPTHMAQVIGEFHLTRDLAFQGLLTQNVLAICIGLSALAFVRGQGDQRWMLVLCATFAALFLLGLTVGLNNSAGRICAVLTPSFAALASLALWRFVEKQSGQPA